MNWSKFKLKKIFTVYHVTDSYHFNGKHSAVSYLNTIQQLLDNYDLLKESTLLRYNLFEDHFIARFMRTNPTGFDIICAIDFESTTLEIKVIE